MSDTTHIQLAHGGGGQLTAELIEQVILPALGGPQQIGSLNDSAVLDAATGRLALTTDSYVVHPLEFPGGDIGKLAICGTVNDLAMAGARPTAMTMALIVEEGLEIALLKRILESAGQTAAEVGVAIVTGDTKVVPRGALDGLMINTAGLGEVLPGADLGFPRILPGDSIVLSGPLGEHGLAVMAMRKGLSFSSDLLSDCAPLSQPAAALVEALGSELHFMRDPTRGGLAATLVDLAGGSSHNVEIDETSIPVNPTALGAAEILGLDLLTVANEGKLVAVVSPEACDRAVEVLQKHQAARQAAAIGRITESADTGQLPLVEMITKIGGRRIVQMPYGEELPRIC
ncbi:MAG: hydrogenase expression/formation protein HypE [Phycisphaerae bacterium]|jgi:hydrogenase expression/formation protein HypE|nr:hydrogenase expression/formation protein HypE [Phycisphaerae bacterium]